VEIGLRRCRAQHPALNLSFGPQLFPLLQRTFDEGDNLLALLLRRIELHGYLVARTITGFNGGVTRPAAWTFVVPVSAEGDCYSATRAARVRA